MAAKKHDFFSRYFLIFWFIYYSLVTGYNFWVINMINNVDFLLKFVKNNGLFLMNKKTKNQWNNNFNTSTSSQRKLRGCIEFFKFDITIKKN